MQKSLKYLRDAGYTCGITENWNPYARVRADLFGFIDIVCIDHVGGNILGVQTTSTGNINARIKKIQGIKDARYWLQVGAKIYVHGWSKKGRVGKRKLWTLDEREITLSDFK